MTCAVCVAFLVFIVSMSQTQSSATYPTHVPSPNPSAPAPALVPLGYQPYLFAAVIGTNVQAPVVELWEDFQCSECKEVHDSLSRRLADLAADGKIRLALRPVTVLDVRQEETASLDATAAWGCAIDQGKALEYRQMLFGSQPSVRGTPRSADEFVSLAQRSGLDGPPLAAFTSCLAEGRYRTWAVNGSTAFFFGSIPRVPWLVVDGAPVDVTDPAKLDAALSTLS